MKRIIAKVILLVLFITLLPILPTKVNAASKSVSAAAVEDFVAKAESVKGQYLSYFKTNYNMPNDQWCGYFVGWALDHSLIATETGRNNNMSSMGLCIAPLTVMAKAGYGTIYLVPGSSVSSLKEHYYNRFVNEFGVPTNAISQPSTFTPQRGDIVLYAWTADGTFDHTGIMRSATDTVEGNTSGNSLDTRYVNFRTFSENSNERKNHAVAFFRFNTEGSFASTSSQYQLYWPVPSSVVSIGSCSSGFGPRSAPTSGASTNHRGIDIPVPSGTIVYSAYDGEVISVSSSNARGNYVVVYHSSIGLSTLYQHLTSSTVQKGDRVSGGSQIAISGSTGVGTGPHLHFGVMQGKASGADSDQTDMAINPLGSNISYRAVGEQPASDNPDDYPVPTRILNYWYELMTGNDVRWVQAVLNKLGYPVDIDGSFGPSTETAVKNFQRDNGMEVDGSVGPDTRAKLVELWNKKKSDDNTYTASINVSSASVSLDYPTNSTTSITMSVSGTYPDNCGIYISTSPSGVISWSGTSGSEPITITALKPGIATITIKLKQIDTQEVITYKSVLVTVKYSKYNISLNANGGSVSPNKVVVEYGSTIGTLPTPTKQGYTFDGWYTSASGGTKVTASTAVTGNMTLYALWKPIPTGLSVNSSYTASISTAGEKKYYTYTPSSSGKYVIYSTGTSENDAYVTLYDASGNKLTYDDDGAGGRQFLLAYELTAGTQYKYEVKFYDSSKTGSIPFTFGKVYTVTYNVNGGSIAPAIQEKYYGKTLTLTSDAPTRSGYTFLGWSTSSTASTATYQLGDTYSGNANLTLYAVWQANPTAMNVNSSYTASISTAGEKKYYTYTPSSSGKYVIYSTGTSENDAYVTLYDASGNKLTYNDDGAGGRQFLLAYELTAGTQYKYEVKFYDSSKTGSIPFTFGKVYTVTYNVNGGSIAPATQEKYYGKTLTLTSDAPTRSGYTFLGWSTNSTATTATYQPGATYSGNANTTLYAVWQANPTVMLGDVNNDGEIDAADAGIIARYDAGFITLTAEQKLAGDVNKDGEVDAADAGLISRYDAGFITRF